MNKMIKKGYQLTITSWENDGDAYKTQIISGLSQEKLKFFIDVMSNFFWNHRFAETLVKGKYYHGGNKNISDEKVVEIINDTLSRYPDVKEEIMTEYDLGHENDEFEEEWDREEYISVSYRKIITDLLGHPVSEYYDKDFVRVACEYQVHYIPLDVEDVTQLFSMK